jgi:hypothetical protein
MSRYDDGTDRFSHTEISTWRDCKRKWMLTYHLGLQRRERDVRFPTEVGNLVHGAFEQFYLSGGIENPNAEQIARQWLIDKRAEDLAECIGEYHPTIIDAHRTADACLSSYLNWVHESGADLNLRILGSEDKIEIEGPLPNTRLNGRIDLLAEDERTGDIVVIDLKLVSSITEKIRMLHLDTQSKLYAMLARSKFGRPVKVAFRIVKINKRSAKVKGAQEDEYTIVLNDGQIDTYRQQLSGVLGEIVTATERLNSGEHHQVVTYPSPSDACSWKCTFFPVCPLIDDPLSDAEWLLGDLYTKRERTSTNPETAATVVKSHEAEGGSQ